jgi:DNA-binding NarL/FixJ family response regulator
LGGDAIPLSMRVSVVARDLELWGREFGSERAAETLRQRSERAYDPAVVDAALDLGVERLRRCDADLWETVLHLEPDPRIVVEGSGAVGRALGALGDFADLKAPEMTGHSRRVRRIVDAAGEIARLSGEECEMLGMAASVHDVGVVAAPARVWRGSGGSPAEVEQARAHPMWSQRLLARVAGLGEVAALAGRHHERLDGTGYPSGLDGDLGRSAGVLVCAELFDEHMRETGSADLVVEEMTRLVGAGALSAGDVRVVLEAVGVSMPLVEVERPAGLTEREVDVLRLLAKGHTNRQIANQLGISTRTAGSHVEHIYAKAGVRSRAAATLFAVGHDLVG